jgi:hypothetical protein
MSPGHARRFPGKTLESTLPGTCSVSKVIKHGYDVKFVHDNCYTSKRSTSELFRSRTRRRGYYILDATLASDCIYLTVLDNPEDKTFGQPRNRPPLCQRRLDHHIEGRREHLASLSRPYQHRTRHPDGARGCHRRLSFISSDSDKTPGDPCQLGKQRRNPITMEPHVGKPTGRFYESRNVKSDDDSTSTPVLIHQQLNPATIECAFIALASSQLAYMHAENSVDCVYKSRDVKFDNGPASAPERIRHKFDPQTIEYALIGLVSSQSAYTFCI